ncbi:MAG: iron-sulfur cluster-binding domain-containing protein [Bacteroidetes bacterium]|nr:iron-sulfur cluster-binding domain-containing protein [Bacteroidota bacterium]
MNIIKLRVAAIREEATDAVTIVLEPLDGVELRYKAGQFLTFLFLFQGHEYRRSYSFASTPGVDPLPFVTVKRVTNGVVSRYLIDHLQAGDVLTCLPAAGKFLLEEESLRPLVFVSAGSGMTPVYGLIKEALYKKNAQRVVLITQNRDRESIFFRSALEGMVSEWQGRFEWFSLLSSSARRLNNALLSEMLDSMPEWGERPRFFLCGPPGFMRMAIFTLRLMGVADEEIRRENFVVEYVPPPPAAVDKEPKEVVLYAEGRRMSFMAQWPSTILQAALDQGIMLPYSCKGGRCGSCAAKCVKGMVRMSINEVLMEKDLEQGLVLTCVGYAETDLELRLSED